MTINPTAFAIASKSSVNWADANRRVVQAYRNWQRSAPEIVKLYLLDVNVPAVRAKIRQEFERHRHVKDLSTVDVLLAKNNAEYQETMNYWKQLSHIMHYFRTDEDSTAKIPRTFVEGFLQGRN